MFPKSMGSARARGLFVDEIIPVGDVKEDDGVRPGTTAESLAKLKPVFDPEHGSTTARNASQLTDGAAAVLLMMREEAEKRHLHILEVWRSFVVKGHRVLWELDLLLLFLLLVQRPV
jgi:acetyl-CoA acetyltransferase